MSLSTTNGNINCDVPAGTSTMVTATVGNGTISMVDLAMEDQVVSVNQVTGRLGSGDGQLTLSTVNGSVVLTGI